MRRAAASLALLAIAVAAAPAAHGATATATAETAYCSSLGVKLPGMRSTRRQADRIEARFRAAGLDTRIEDFHVPTFSVAKQRIEVTAPRRYRVPGESFYFSGAGVVEAPVVAVGVGQASDYAGKDVRGKIVMVDRNVAFHRSAQLTQVLAHGGAAMLYVSETPDNLVQTGTVRFASDLPSPIPTMTVGASDGAALKDEIARGLRMRLTVDGRRVDAIGRNVIGIRRGSRHPGRYIVVGAHYDNWHAGAIDNCTGVGSLLQIVERTRSLDPAYTIVFAAWDAEEIGLVGSYDFVKRNPEIVRNTVLNENLEMTSAKTYAGETALGSLANVVFATSNPLMNLIVHTAAAANGHLPVVPLTVGLVRGISGGIIPTDLQPFYTAGVQGFSTFSQTPYYHTAQDTPERVDPFAHVRSTNFLEAALRNVQALAPEQLAQREVPSVTVRAPARVTAGTAFEIEATIADANGRALEGVAPEVIVNQRDNWAVAKGSARGRGGGRYRYTVPAGTVAGGLTDFTVSLARPGDAAQGYASTSAVKSRPRLSLRARRIGTRAGRVRYRFAGALRTSAPIPVETACRGMVRLTFRGVRHGARKARLRRSGRRCLFTRRIALPTRRGARAIVRARYGGSDFLRARSARRVRFAR